MVKFIEAGLVSHIHKINQSTIYKSTRGDWTHLGILHGRARRAGTHPPYVRIGLDRLLPARQGAEKQNKYRQEGPLKTPEIAL